MKYEVPLLSQVGTWFP